jgi:hypothetical protein
MSIVMSTCVPYFKFEPAGKFSQNIIVHHSNFIKLAVKIMSDAQNCELVQHNHVSWESCSDVW